MHHVLCAFASGHHSSIAILLFCRPETIPVQEFKHIFIVTAKTMQQNSLKITFQVIGRQLMASYTSACSALLCYSL